MEVRRSMLALIQLLMFYCRFVAHELRKMIDDLIGILQELGLECKPASLQLLGSSNGGLG